ncbi:hypothetical protein [Bradyrhizobium sp. AZCC 2289]|uniref:hypothetical protein n=1 Tax=Bradyrhizobium sp. AZCC 2289 TaxID=3117026 RepID=UPI002FF409CA
MTTDQIIMIIASVLGGGIGGLAAIAAYTHGYLNTERVERRKQKIDLVQELMASRYALDPAYAASDVDVRDINRAMARIPYVFSDNPSVIAALDRLISDKTTDNLMAVLEQALSAAGLKQYAVSRSHLARVLTIPRR